MKKCRVCGQENNDSDMVCGVCGETLFDAAAAESELELFELGQRSSFTLKSGEGNIELTDSDISERLGCEERCSGLRLTLTFSNSSWKLKNNSENGITVTVNKHGNVGAEDHALSDRSFIRILDPKHTTVYAFVVRISSKALEFELCMYCGLERVKNGVCTACNRKAITWTPS